MEVEAEVPTIPTDHDALVTKPGQTVLNVGISAFGRRFSKQCFVFEMEGSGVKCASCTTKHLFRGVEYVVTMSVDSEREVLSLEVEDRLTADQWTGQFDAKCWYSYYSAYIYCRVVLRLPINTRQDKRSYLITQMSCLHETHLPVKACLLPHHTCRRRNLKIRKYTCNSEPWGSENLPSARAWY